MKKTTKRPLRGKKLLIAKAGMASVVFSACALFPGCNLALRTCENDPTLLECRDQGVQQDLASTPDLERQDSSPKDLTDVD